MVIWQPFSETTLKPPSAFHAWLSGTGSLTQYLRQLCGLHQTLTLHLWKTGFEAPSHAEANYLTYKEPVWIREITFSVNDQYWEYSRVIIPKSSLMGDARALQTWGEQPLGDLLFQDPQLTRSPIEIAELSPDNAYYQQAQHYTSFAADTLWARRSCLHFHGQPLMIVECLLPALAAQL